MSRIIVVQIQVNMPVPERLAYGLDQMLSHNIILYKESRRARKILCFFRFIISLFFAQRLGIPYQKLFEFALFRTYEDVPQRARTSF